MSARKLVYRSMVFAPAVFLIGIGVNARGLNNDFDVVANDPPHEEAILAYVPYLKQSQPFLDWTGRSPVSEARKVAKIWIAGADRGELKPLTPIAFEDTSSEGSKSEIFEINGRIVNTLLSGIGKSIREGNYHQAVTDASLAVRLAGIVKHSDFISLFNSATAQRRALVEVGRVADHLDAEDREKLASLLPVTQTKAETIDRMLKRSRQLFVSWRERKGYEPLSIEDTQLLSDIPAMVENGNAVALKQMRQRMFASQDDYVPTYCSSLRIGMGAQDQLHREIRSLVIALNMKKASH